MQSEEVVPCDVDKVRVLSRTLTGVILRLPTRNDTLSGDCDISAGDYPIVEFAELSTKSMFAVDDRVERWYIREIDALLGDAQQSLDTVNAMILAYTEQKQRIQVCLDGIYRKHVEITELCNTEPSQQHSTDLGNLHDTIRQHVLCIRDIASSR